MLDDVRQKIIDLRAKAIAISELGGIENLGKARTLLIECQNLFKEILPDNNYLGVIYLMQGSPLELTFGGCGRIIASLKGGALWGNGYEASFQIYLPNFCYWAEGWL